MHVGVLRKLQEMGIRLAAISGCSAGALVGALFAAGHAPAAILEIAESLPFSQILTPAWSRRGLLDTAGLGRFLQKHLPENFEGLSMPFTCNATDVERSETIYFSSGRLVPALLASCCIPLVFRAVEWEGRILLDGGILNNLPIEPLEATCDRVIGSHCNHTGEFYAIRSPKQIGERSFRLAVNQNIRGRAARCWRLIDPPQMGEYDVFAYKKLRAIEAIGYLAASEMDWG
jgi:NTE family protein